MHVSERMPGVLCSLGREPKVWHRSHLIVTFCRTNARKTVELRGLEPLASCMLFLAILSGTVAGSRMPAVQSRCAVRMCPSLPAAVWVRSHLVSHWFCRPPKKVKYPGLAELP